MKHLFICASLILGMLCLCACGSENEDKVQQPEKDGSVEAVFTVNHGNGYDVLKVTRKVWVKGKIEREIVNTDTLPNLGMTKDTSDEDDDGNVTVTTVPKDYQFFITVK